MESISSTYNSSAANGYEVKLRQERAAGVADVEVGRRTKIFGSGKSDSQRGFQLSDSNTTEFIPYSPPRTQNGTDIRLPTADGTGSPQVQAEVAKLKSTEEKIKAHEAAHKSAGGTMTGPVSFSYTRGPDGKNYITGGEVPISVSSGKTPQETISRMQQVIQAALAPADPSPQDRAVAAQAAALQQQARQNTTETSPSKNEQTSGFSQKDTSASAPTDTADLKPFSYYA